MNDDRTQKIVDAVADVTRSGLGQVSGEHLDAGWQRLEGALDEGRYPRMPIVAPAPRWWLRGLALSAAALALGFATYRLVPSRAEAPLGYVVEGAVLEPGEVVQTPAGAPARLVFSDTSTVKVGPGTRVRVLGLDAHGARVALADGELDAQVRHLAGTSWRFDAGPFSVKVVGTAFHLAFEAERGRMVLQMASGVVEVRGPSEDRVFTLRAGESLELFAGASAPAPSSHPTVAAPAAPTPGPAPTESAPPATEPAPAHAGSAPARRRTAHVDTAIPDTGNWAHLIAQGDFAAVVRAAEQRGIDATLAGASAADLTALADAARYTRRNDLARQALLGVRARFPGTARASDAAFFLGRLAEVGPSSGSAALAWYETYLDESGRGPYAGEALGREIALLSRTDRARARQAAESYLERFPHGTQAELAKSLLGEARAGR
jgi:hypothetical protein